MKKLLLVTLMIFCGVAFSANESFLFFQTATEGNLKKVNNNHYLLTIQHAPKYVNYFSDRPVRKSGIMKLAKFNSFWTNDEIKNNFKTNPPNVAIVLVDAQGKRQDLVAIASNPKLSKEQLTYELQPIKTQNVYIGPFKYMLMITDDISWNPGGF
ncbi:hypothetical protein [Legionella quateirensis]|uniref:Uncharacterized protein n=1 Tax=Legionella quateirensis TaxID=45072 RepID=A0A378KUD8_9GAMM|nr:hypothetical protein [Legionella quateirensis]KTD53001.1 hypothetical protein Lqua_0834 [Legionella quateirensis]STY17221.1 Uncharacterised protein [Legionella quateirensis]